MSALERLASLAPHEAAEFASELLGGGFAVANESSAVNFRWAGSSLTTNGSITSTSITVVAIDPSDRVGTASSSGELTRDVVVELVARAEAVAADSQPAEEISPMVTPSEAGDSPAVWASTRPEVSLDGVADFTTRLGSLFAGVSSSDYALYGFAEQAVSSVWLASTTGLRLRHDQPSGSVAATGRAHDGRISTWAGRQAPRLDDVDVTGLGVEIATKFGWAKAPVSVEPGRQQVILTPSAVSDLMIIAHWQMSGRNAREGRSPYSNGASTKLDDRLAPKGVSLYSDPAHPAMPCEPFHIASSNGALQSVFDTGLATARTHWITDGVLTNLVETRAGAAANGRNFTPMGSNLVLDAGGEKTFEDLVASTERALLINTLWYIRDVDPTTMLLTGLTRDGVYLVEDGEIKGAASNFRWNDSPLGVLDRIVDSARPELCLPREWGDWWERAMMSPLRVADFNISSVSAAI